MGIRNLALFKNKKEKYGEGQEHNGEATQRNGKEAKVRGEKKTTSQYKERTDDRTIAELPSDEVH